MTVLTRIMSGLIKVIGVIFILLAMSEIILTLGIFKFAVNAIAIIVGFAMISFINVIDEALERESDE